MTEIKRTNNTFVEFKGDMKPENIRHFIAAQEAERKEIVSELNENISQILSSAKLYLECVTTADAGGKEYLATARKLIVEAIDEQRRMARQLNLPKMTSPAFIGSVSEMLSRMISSPHTTLDLQHDGFVEATATNEIKTIIYRIIQEYVGNILRLTCPNSIFIVLGKNRDFYRLSIRSDTNVPDAGSNILEATVNSITVRAAAGRGFVTIRTRKDKATVLVVSFPSALSE